MILNFSSVMVADAGHCEDAIQECAADCATMWWNPIFMGACGDGCIIGYVACLVFL